MVATMLGLLLFAVPSELPEGVSPGAGIGLAPNPIVRPASEGPSGGENPRRTPTPTTFPVSLSALVGAAALGVGYRRRREDPLVVVVHGDGGSAQDFRFLVNKLGIDPDRVVAFDYSSIDGGVSSTESSRTGAGSDARARPVAPARHRRSSSCRSGSRIPPPAAGRRRRSAFP